MLDSVLWCYCTQSPVLPLSVLADRYPYMLTESFIVKPHLCMFSRTYVLLVNWWRTHARFFCSTSPTAKTGPYWALHFVFCSLLVPLWQRKTTMTGQCLYHRSHGSGFWWAENKYIVGDWTDEQTNQWTRMLSRVAVAPERAPGWRASGTGLLSPSPVLWIYSFT